MGQSTDGILFYGIELGEDDPIRNLLDPDGDSDDEHPEFEDWLCEAAGGPKRAVWNHDTSNFEPPLREYWAARDAFLKASGGLDSIGLGIHCSGDYPMYFLHSRHTSASRGYPEALESDALGNVGNLEALEQVAGLLKLDAGLRRGWYLASLWS